MNAKTRIWIAIGCLVAVSPGCERRSADAGAGEVAPKGEAAPPDDPETAAPEVVAPPSLLAGVIDRAIEAPPEGGSTYRVDAYLGALIIEELRRDPMPFTPWRSDGSDPARPTAGYRVGGLAPDDLWTRLGLREGDIVHALNGIPTADAGWIASALQQGENRITASVFRDDVSFVLSYRLMGAMAWNGLRHDLAPPTEVVLAPPVDDEPSEPSDPPRATGADPRGGGGSKSAGGTSKGGAGKKPKGKSVAQCSSSSRCTLDKAYFDSLVRSPSKIESQAKIVPAIRNDVHSGYKLRTVRSGSVVAQLGFRAGDKITHINGRDLTNDLEAMQLYMGLSGTRSFKVRYVRGGSARTKTIDVR